MQTLNAQAKTRALAAPLASYAKISAAMASYKEQWPDLFLPGPTNCKLGDIAHDLAEYTYADLEPKRHLFQSETPERYYIAASRFVYGIPMPLEYGT